MYRISKPNDNGLTYGLHLYAAIVKNLRGVVFSLSEEKILERGLKWLTRHFKYRSLGFAPSIVEKYKLLERYLERRQFIKLWYPTRDFRTFVNELERLLEIGRVVIESLSFSSAYVSPLIIIGEDSVEELESFSLLKVMSNKQLTDSDIKLHLRIADYSVLDMYAWSVENAHNILNLVIRGKSYNRALEDRVKRVYNDSRRFWRIAENNGKCVVMYLDLLSPLLRKCKAEVMKRLIESYSEVALSAFGIIAGFVLTVQ